jgi:hypothetical protein
MLSNRPQTGVDITAAWLKIRTPPHPFCGALEVLLSPPKVVASDLTTLVTGCPHYIANAWPHYPVLAADGNGSTIDSEEMRKDQ